MGEDLGPWLACLPLSPLPQAGMETLHGACACRHEFAGRGEPMPIPELPHWGARGLQGEPLEPQSLCWGSW